MPDLDVETGQLLSLRARCRQYRVLPMPGGLLEQPAWIMDAFDVIDEKFSLDRKRRAEEAETEQRKQWLKQRST